MKRNCLRFLFLTSSKNNQLRCTNGVIYIACRSPYICSERSVIHYQNIYIGSPLVPMSVSTLKHDKLTLQVSMLLKDDYETKLNRGLKC